MEHLTDIELIQYAAGQTDEARAAAIAAHVKRCDPCASRLREIGVVNAGMESWRKMGTDGIDLWPGIMAAIQDEESVARDRRWWIGPMRLAASLLVSVGVGHLVARSLWQKEPVRYVTVDEAKKSLGLSLVSFDAPAGLEDAISGDDDASEVTQ